jgi:hypothetical protein
MQLWVWVAQFTTTLLGSYSHLPHLELQAEQLYQAHGFQEALGNPRVL